MKKLLTVFLTLVLTSIAVAAYADGGTPETHSHCICGVQGCTENHEETGTAVWQAWDGDTAVGTVNDASKTAVYLYLEDDVVITDTLNITDVTVYLCLNGKTLTINKEGYPAVCVGENQKFVLCDCKKTGRITGAKGSANGDAKRFGAINCRTGSNFVMYGGSISDNEVKRANGGGVYVNGGTLTIHGGSFKNNKAPNGSGGALSVENGKIYTDGGVMTGNGAINGGAVHLKGSTKAEINNIKLNNNTATNMGGAMFTEVSVAMKIENCEFGGNKAANGGGIYIKYAADNIYSNIYNINVHDNSAVTVEGKRTGYGGGIYLDGFDQSEPAVSIYDSEICKNSSGKDGGGIYVTSGIRFNLFGGTVSNNSCIGSGGGIRVESGTYFIIAERKGVDSTLYIKENTADVGGGISSNASSLNIVGKCEIEGNIADTAGGGLYINGTYVWLIFQNATITKNVAPNGGGVYLNKGNSGRELEICNGTSIIGNTSSKNGAANNLYLNNGRMFQFRNTVNSNTKIGVSVSKMPTVDEPTGIVYKGGESWSDGSDRTNLIESDDGDYMVIYNGDSNMHLLVPCYTVTINPNNGDETQIIKVKCGDVLNRDLLKTPTHSDGYVFDTWCVDGVPYDFDSPVNGNITITAKWISPNRTRLEVTANNVVVFNLDRPAVLYVASYNKNELLDIKVLKLDKTEKKFIVINENEVNDGIHINTENATKITAFLWDYNISPLCESASSEIPTE